MTLHFSRPELPVDRTYSVAFNGRVRHVRQNQTCLLALEDARHLLEGRRTIRTTARTRPSEAADGCRRQVLEPSLSAKAWTDSEATRLHEGSAPLVLGLEAIAALVPAPEWEHAATVSLHPEAWSLRCGSPTSATAFAELPPNTPESTNVAGRNTQSVLQEHLVCYVESRVGYSPAHQ